MLGLLLDVNIHEYAAALRRNLVQLDLVELLDQSGLNIVTFSDLGIADHTDDQTLWMRCQVEGWVLFTENRNQDGPTSLETTLRTFWTAGQLPVLTLGSKRRFRQERDYSLVVSADVLEYILDIQEGKYRDQPRIYVPR